jgi:hypothetical protein
VKISAAIMAHPRRARLVESLVRRVGLGTPVVWDERNHMWDTGRRALLAYDPSASHHVIIQDDAVPCADLLAGLPTVLEHVPPESPVGLYYGSIRPARSQWKVAYRRAVRAGHHWIASVRAPLWGVAICLPVEQIKDVVAYGDLQKPNAYDGRVRRWYQNQGIEQWFPIPSLVDHRTGEGEPSLVPNRSNNARRAHEFIGVDRSPLDVDWNTGVTR